MSSELPIEEPPRWIVVPIYQRISAKHRKRGIVPDFKRHELRFDGKTYETAYGPAQENRLRDLARLFNQRKATPARPSAPTAQQPDLFS